MVDFCLAYVSTCSTGDLKTLSLQAQGFAKFEINYPCFSFFPFSLSCIFFSPFFPFSLPPISLIDQGSVVYFTSVLYVPNITQESLVNTLSFISTSR